MRIACNIFYREKNNHVPPRTIFHSANLIQIEYLSYLYVNIILPRKKSFKYKVPNNYESRATVPS